VLEIRDLGASLLARGLELFAFHLRFYGLPQNIGVGVAKLVGVPLPRERVDEPMREIHLLLRPSLTGFRQREILR
jgi:hypothetical protein